MPAKKTPSQQTTPPIICTTCNCGVGTHDMWFAGREEEAEEERNGCSEWCLISCICNVGTSLSIQPCAQAPVHSVFCLAFLHAIAPQDMAICHRLGPLINTAPALHDSSQCTCTHTWTHTFTLSISDRWVKRWATSCVK